MSLVLLLFCNSVTKSCPTLCNPMNYSMLGFPALHCLLEFANTHAQWLMSIQPSHPLSPSYPFAFNLPQHQSLFQWVGSSHQVVKVLEHQLQPQFFQWIFKFYFLKDWLVWSPYCLRNSQEPSPALHLDSINLLALSLLYGLTLASIHDCCQKAVTKWNFVGKVMSLLFNTLSRFVFFPEARVF